MFDIQRGRAHMEIKKSWKRAFFSLNMQSYCQKFNRAFTDVRWSRLRYMLIFTHAPLFANMGGYFFSDDPYFLGLDAESWMRIAYCLGAGLLFIFASLRNMRTYAKVLSLCSASFFLAWVLFTDGMFGVFLSSGFTFFYGGCGAIAIYHFAYMLNHSERFLGATLTSLFYTIFQFDFAIGFLSSVFSRAYMLGLVAVTLVCMLTYREQDYEEVRNHEENMCARDSKQKRSVVALTFYFFFAYHIVEMFYTYMQGNSEHNLILVSGIAGILVLIISFYLFFATQFNLWHMCNLFFLTMFMSYILLFWENSGVWLLLSRAFHGGEQIGFIASYCMIWGMLREYVTFKHFKWILVATLNIFFFVYAFLGKAVSVNLESLPLLSCVVTFLLFLVFLLLSPSYAYIVFRKDHSIKEKEMFDVEQSLQKEPDSYNRQLELWQKKMEFYKMTEREKQVCHLLLQGYATKQVAAELNISIDTVKFHIKNIYKKLGNSGKNALFAAFNTFDDSPANI